MILAFDGRMGASGDMLLGALLAAGADPAVLDPVEAQLDVLYDIGTATRCGIEATTVTVRRTGQRAEGGSGGHVHDGTHEHTESNDSQNHNGTHEHTENNDHQDRAEGAGPHRTFPEVVEVIESLGLPADVETDVLAIFELLGEAEAAVHGTDLAETAFHEVGADDAIADVVGAALLLADIDPDRVVTTPLAAGSGVVEMSHGVYPVPAPAVVQLAERANWSLRSGPVEAELLTPTGAAILTHAAEGVESLPSLQVSSSGYGAGDRSFEQHPNVLRVLTGTGTGNLRREPVTVLETHLDDATPEALGGLQDTLTEAGALDVTVLPTTMKKSRPGHLVKVVVESGHARRVARRLAEETGTLGVREHGSGHRFVADREQHQVTLEIDGEGVEVTVKIARIGDDIYDISAEFDDALAVSRRTDLPVRAVLRRAERACRDSLGDDLA
ncbi:MAG: conserved hypothetical protein TIGR00299 [halophilic archaeon J07HX64]|jgi:conserved hypothetical protein TIGR00299|nr:MAG: conserved hypothetical protein TIGR00299 [halophilic archaeon J07HX64]